MPDASRTSDSTSASTRADLTVYYDGGCPVCRREIAVYRRMNGAEALHWVDVSRCEPAELGADLTVDEARAVMHVRDARGRLVSGAAAFAAIWRQLPKTRWLGKLASTRLALAVLEPGYRLFLTLRKLWR